MSGTQIEVPPLTVGQISTVQANKDRVELTSSYRPQLDGLRAVAVLGVLVEHFWGSLSKFEPWGHYGVLLFFVLSGYLITGILLAQRSAMDRGIGLGAAARKFYIRRCLRIFPAYYLTLLVLWRWGYTSIRDPMVWHLTYTTNFWTAIHGVFAGVAGPYWSLSVEEQFYLVWPWIMLLSPKTTLGPTMFVVALLGPVSRCILNLAGHDGLEPVVLPTSCVDSLAGGAIIAWWTWKQGVSRCAQTPIARWGGATGILGLFGVSLSAHVGLLPHLLSQTLKDFFTAGCFCWVVANASDGFAGSAGRILSNPVVRYLGRVSYGIYLYHMAVLFAIRDISFKIAKLEWHPSEPIQFLVCSTITICIASLSWYVFERPILRLKDKFKY